MNIKIVFLVLALPLSVGVAAADRYFDKSQEKYDLNRLEYFKLAAKKCGSKKNVGEREACRQVYIDEANAKFPPRGSVPYSKKNYSGLTEAQAKEQLVKLKKIYDVARPALRGRPGEITSQQVASEASWIQEHIFGRRTFSGPLSFYFPCEKQLAGSPIRKYCEIGGDKVLEGSIYSTE
ncbi:TPA: hypothetical protein ACRNCK_005061 [Pseudomonas aeruginosa]|uniref:hypothetical protein n=2 Tax=Pseudomonas aeruginosa TaxID=287 RepID=UPI0010495E61|nr:hypothetical protein [Pseudomonas aeruginosa]NPW56346.1 hypothetical protein [Pseudomonas aeruginosa]NTT94421.1 hypothetical protein [Pseudomonas aeruginosa]HBO1396334.1 hypothetical protein [Pseudomonas aeruginosa]HBO1787783.1 hypothetical protein [Pseudomonas aeruginosa]HCE6882154.1 hypothetical protein [Pseudomonas aeruginosa]